MPTVAAAETTADQRRSVSPSGPPLLCDRRPVPAGVALEFAQHFSGVASPPPGSPQPTTHCDYNLARACAAKPRDILTTKWITGPDNLRAARIRPPSPAIPHYRFRANNLRLRSAVKSSGSVFNLIRAFFSRIPSQVLSR